MPRRSAYAHSRHMPGVLSRLPRGSTCSDARQRPGVLRWMPGVVYRLPGRSAILSRGRMPEELYCRPRGPADRDSLIDAWGVEAHAWGVVSPAWCGGSFSLASHASTQRIGKRSACLPRPTRRCSRPLRARDRWYFERWYHALAAAERHTVGRAPSA
jgi:hypothetical protein